MTSAVYRVYGDKIDVISNSEYACHLVIDGKIWWDAEPYEDCSMKIGDGFVDVTIKTGEEPVFAIKSESIGVVNTDSVTHYFVTGLPMTCVYDSTPYIKANVAINDRNLIPVFCSMFEVTNKTFKCTTKVYNGDYLLQANPEPLYDDSGLIKRTFTPNRNYGYFTAKPENAASQNVLLYYTNKGLRDGQNATLQIDCVSGTTQNTITTVIVPEYKDLFESLDTADKARQQLPYLMVFIVGFMIAISVLIYFIRKAKKDFRP